MSDSFLEDIDFDKIDWKAVKDHPDTGVASEDGEKFFFLAVIGEDQGVILGEIRYRNPSQFNAWVQCQWGAVNFFANGGTLDAYRKAIKSH